MPLPMPRCVISSPSHMTSAVPAVHVRMISAARHGVKGVISLVPCGQREPGLPEQTAVAALHHEHQRGRLHERQTRP